MTLTLINTSNKKIVEKYRFKAYNHVEETLKNNVTISPDGIEPSKHSNTDEIFDYFCKSIISNTVDFIRESIEYFNQSMNSFNVMKTIEITHDIEDESGPKYSVTNPKEVPDEKTKEMIDKLKPVGIDFIYLSLGGPIGDYAIEKTNKYIEDATKSTSGGKRNHQKRKPTKKKRKFTKKRSSPQ